MIRKKDLLKEKSVQKRSNKKFFKKRKKKQASKQVIMHQKKMNEVNKYINFFYKNKEKEKS